MGLVAAALGMLSAALFSSLGRIDALGTSLRTEMRDLRGELKADIAEVRTEVRELRTELHVEIAAIRGDLGGF